MFSRGIQLIPELSLMAYEALCDNMETLNIFV